MMRSLFRISLLTALFAAVLFNMPARAQFPLATGNDRDSKVQLQKLNDFYRYLNTHYIDTVDNAKLVETAIKDILSELDPHSNYYSPEDMVEMNSSFEGSFSGIGIQFNMLRDTLNIVDVISGGPSEKVGIIPGDKITDVDGNSIIGISQSQVLTTLRGPKGSVVDVDVYRPSTAEKLGFRITRDDIPIYTVDASYVTDDNFGYVRVNRFAQTTMDEMSKAIAAMGEIDGLILDLRGNGGGLLTQAVQMSNYFLPRGARIVSTEARNGVTSHIDAPRNGAYRNGKLVVLIDEFSASASEIVTGALQDWDRAVIVGRRSFGKGLVQRQFPLVDGSAVNITISRYLTPTGRAIQRHFENGNKSGYYEELAERLSSGFTDSLGMYESLAYQTMRLGKTVYGGGGIFPDYYVHSNTSDYSDYWSELIRKGATSEFMNTYIDRVQARVSESYPQFEDFRNGYTVPDSALDELAAVAERKGIEPDPQEMERIAPRIKAQLKALLAQRIWTANELYRILNFEGDAVFDKGVEVLRDWDRMADGIATSGI